MKQSPLVTAAVIALGAIGWYVLRPGQDLPEVAAEGVPAEGSAIVSIVVPETLDATSVTGKGIYEAKCLSCHGENATGQHGVAPPLVHKIYEPSHHADEAFQRAVALGVRQHHWTFGDMPPVEGLTRGDVAMVVAYVRELQRANGID